MSCRKVSPACAHCYAERDMTRYGRDFSKVTRTKDATFYAPVKWKEPKLIFTCSWSDFFIEEADAWRGFAWDIMRRTPQHTYQILTKRPERVEKCLPGFGPRWPWKNVWLGISVENQLMADKRIPILLNTFAALRFLSVEPLLGRVDLEKVGPSKEYPGLTINALALTGGLRHINWVIVGGESGSKARPLNLDYVRSIRDQCAAADVPFFVKQLTRNGKQVRFEEFPCDLQIREMPYANQRT